MNSGRMLKRRERKTSHRRRKKLRPTNYLLELNFFDPRIIKPDSTIAFIGKRRSGKSFALRNILFYLRGIQTGIVVSETEEANPFFENFVPSSYIFNEYNPDITKQIFKTQKREKKRAEKFNRKPEDFFYILDDCLYDSTIKSDESIRKIFFNGRHYNILFVITMQYPLGIPPALRANIDFVFIFKDNNESIRDKLFKAYGGALKTRAFFDKAMDNLGPFECLVFNNSCVNNGSDNVDEVSYFKAEETSNYKMGCEDYWRAHFEHMRKNPEEDSDEEDSDEDILSSVRDRNNGSKPLSEFSKDSHKYDFTIDKKYR
jgi:hypothetical protein